MNKKVAIIGQGYVGLPLSVFAAEAGWDIIGIDSNIKIVEDLNEGISHIEDIESSRLKQLIGSNYEATTDFSKLQNCKIIIICVPTPLDDNSEPDLRFLVSASKAIANHVSENSLIISESTSFPGTLREIVVEEILNLIENKNKRLQFASAPERVNPGDKNWNHSNTPRLVGGLDENSTTRAVNFYKTICSKVISTSSPEVAEMAKLLENSFRLINISMINEIARICIDSKISIREVIDAAATKPYGFMPFWPGSGIGGHCIPVDPIYLSKWADKSGTPTESINFAIKFNENMGELIISRIEKLEKKIDTNSKILLLGVSYKPGISDYRESPAELIRASIKKRGGTVEWFDPMVKIWNGEKPSNLKSNFDFAIIVTNQLGLPIHEILKKKIAIYDATLSVDIAGVLPI